MTSWRSADINARPAQANSVFLPVFAVSRWGSPAPRRLVLFLMGGRNESEYRSCPLAIALMCCSAARQISPGLNGPANLARSCCIVWAAGIYPRHG